METKTMRIKGKALCKFLAVVLVPSLALSHNLISEAHAEVTERTILGSSTVGWNKHYGGPIADMPPEIGTFGFQTVAQYNPGGEAIPIDEPTRASTLLATFLDPEWIQGFGFPEFFLDIAKSNIPMRDIPIRIDSTGVNKMPLKSISEVGQMDVGHAEPNYPITLGDWLRARGEMSFTCFNGEQANVDARFSGLLPNRVYTLREWFRPGTEFIAVPGVFGGAPASFVSDEYGNGEYKARLPFCPPMSADETDHLLFAIAITINLAHESGGLVPVFPLHPVDVSLPGERAMGQIYFPLTGTRLVEGTGPVSDISTWQCDSVEMVSSFLPMASASAPAIGNATLRINGIEQEARTEIAFIEPPVTQPDDSMKFLASLRFELSDGILDGLIEGTFLPTDDPNVVNNDSAVRFVGGEGAYSTVVGDFSLGGTANFGTLVAQITGAGEVCGRSSDVVVSQN